MIVVTGAAGFIGSNMIKKLNDEGYEDIIAVDHFFDPSKNLNIKDRKLATTIDRDSFLSWMDENAESVDFIFHLGARTDTSETNPLLLAALNTDYTKAIWNRCCTHQIPFLYASSASTYGQGELGFSDDVTLIPSLQPLNAYGQSKQDFDLWAIEQEMMPPCWWGLKFFNVYGPREAHKGNMASVINHAFLEIAETGQLKLFRSHRPEIQDGEQKRDFIYIQDVVNTLFWLMNHKRDSGIYNLGTGRARSFNDLANAVFSALELPPQIEYIDTPESYRTNYQYFTEADIQKIKSIGCPTDFYPLEKGVRMYIHEFYSMLLNP